MQSEMTRLHSNSKSYIPAYLIRASSAGRATATYKWKLNILNRVSFCLAAPVAGLEF